MIKVSIVGGSGYAGGELLRLLIKHPYVDIHQITSRKYYKQSISLPHPQLRGKINKNFCSLEELEKCDVIFVCLPNLESMKIMKEILKKAEYVIDLGCDFRIKNLEIFKKYYKTEHLAPEILNNFVYGLPEINREIIKKSKYVACPGCEATAIISTLFPLVKEGILDIKDKIIADVKIGSSAAGSEPSLSTHHPERNNVVRVYQAFNHRHEGEILEQLNINVEITATAIELVRGILSTIYFYKEKITEKDLWKIYSSYYKNESFIRIVNQKDGLYRLPEPKILIGTNYCDIGFKVNENTERIILISAIDNLVKGTAGQAIQCFNIIFNFPEEMSLDIIGLHPV